MKIESITLKGFRCFGDTPKTVKLSDGITALIGANGSGKTALLEGLLRVFGITGKQRTILRTDFYTSPSTPDEDSSTRELYIDIRLTFPELSEDAPVTNPAVPACFRHMVVDQPNGTPFARVRLEAKWVDDRTGGDGDIEQNIYWVLTANELPTDKDKRPCEPTDRGRIQVYYVPAIRDPSSQLISSSGAMIGRLLKAIEWTSETKESIETASARIREVFGKELAINSINQTIASRWKELHNDTFDAEAEFNVASRKFEDIIRKFNIVFSPNEFNGERDLDALSDGQKSLFYFSLVASIFEVESKFINQNIAIKNTKKIDDQENPENTDEDKPSRTGFNSNRIQTPILTIFAFEEPENHLAPYFLSRIIKQVQSIVNEYPAQAILTSHSPAILGRIEPEQIRHFRLDIKSRNAIIKEITLPSQAEEEAKYLREAVKAYPELYFAKFVILGEGDSEQIVLPKLASAMELEVDPAFVAIVPLGGRHVNYFWKLLNDLQIPYATLLDLDIERNGGGWGRIKYALKQLLEIGIDAAYLLKFKVAEGDEQEISHASLETLHTNNEPIDENHPSIKILESFGVFYSAPLDLDMIMLSSFPDAYKAIIDNRSRPRIPDKNNANYNDDMDGVKKAVLGKDANLSTYSEELQELLPWYRYLFLSKSKPSTHLQALCKIDNKDLKQKTPPVLERLLKHTTKEISANKTL